MRAKADIEEIDDNGREAIIITELPYQVNKARLIERIADLVRGKLIEGISELRDESDKDGMRVVIELKRNENAEIVLNNLYKQTPMESVFGVNMVALLDGQPRLLNLKEMIEAFVRHRREVVTRRTVYDLRKARERGHILEGLAVALANIDEVIALIKASPSPAEAKAALLGREWRGGAVPEMLARAGDVSARPEGLEAALGLHGGIYRLSETQAQAILDLRLHRLTGLEQDKILAEYAELLDLIRDLTDILARPERLLQVIRDELIAIREQYGDARRTRIERDESDLTIEDLITPQDVVVTLTHGGYAKSTPVSEYRAQGRGGRGRAGASMKDEDFVEKVFVANTHDTLLCFSSRGQLYWLKVYQLPLAARGARGKPIVNLLPLQDGERITAVLPIREYGEDMYVFMATAMGTVKKTSLVAFSRPRAAGIIALGLDEGDRLVGVDITDGRRDVMLFTTEGKAVRFSEEDVRAMGRTAAGVRGIRMPEGERVISLIIPDPNGLILIASENGYGKQTQVEEFPVHGRGGQGVIAIQTTERNGQLVAAIQVTTENELMLMSSSGVVVRTPASEVSVLGRNTQGVRLMKLDEGERLIGVESVDPEPDGENGEDETGLGTEGIEPTPPAGDDAPTPQS